LAKFLVQQVCEISSDNYLKYHTNGYLESPCDHVYSSSMRLRRINYMINGRFMDCITSHGVHDSEENLRGFSFVCPFLFLVPLL